MELRAVILLGGVAAGKSTLAATLFHRLTGREPWGWDPPFHPTCRCGAYGMMGRWERDLKCPGWDNMQDRSGPERMLEQPAPRVLLVDSHSAAPGIIRALPRPAFYAALIQPPDRVRLERLEARYKRKHSPGYFNKIPGLSMVKTVDIQFTSGTTEYMAKTIIHGAVLVPCKCLA